MGNEALQLEESSSNASTVFARPFVKWAGGKGQLLGELVARMPQQFNTYFEPFLGGGALFFHTQPVRAVLRDFNAELVNAYCVVRDSVEALIEDLGRHKYEKEYFYNIRASDRRNDFESLSDVERASRMIYLNRTCFNGLYRVNSRGEFNVPFGRYSNPTICDAVNLRACSTILQKSDLQVSSFESVLQNARKDDFVYFDPPYAPLSETSSFTGYAKGGFDDGMQEALRDVCVALDSQGVKFMLSNSSAPLVLDLYRDFKLEKILAVRAINSKGNKRGSVEEVIVRNY